MKSSTARGTVTAPPSKSYSHRAMILGALTHAQFVLKSPLISEDTKATLDALHALGSDVHGTPAELKIHCEKLSLPLGVIDARNSGTTIRLIAGIASLLHGPTTLTGDASLVRRPMAPLTDALTQLGAKCTFIGKHGTPPMTISGPITGPRAEISGGISSQFVSSLLIACSQKPSDTCIVVEGPIASRPYVDITIEMLRHFGGVVEEKAGEFSLPGKQSLELGSYTVPGDYSSASFPLVAAAITGGDVTVRKLDRDSPQGDRAIVQHLQAFGAEVSINTESIRVKGGRLAGVEIDVRNTPDLFPVLAVLGAIADGKTVLRGGENLRQKESDRIATTTSFLRDMGVRIRPTDDGCEIVGGEKLHGATVRTDGDHRILMAAAVAALVSSSETRIEDNDSYLVSYPGFMRDMHQLGCRLEVRK